MTIQNTTVSTPKKQHSKTRFLAKHGKLGEILLKDYAENVEEAQKILAEQYDRAWRTKEAFAEAFVHSSYGCLDPDLLDYVDFSDLADDLLSTSYFAIEADNQLHVFFA